eukprot:gene5303-6447_t
MTILQSAISTVNDFSIQTSMTESNSVVVVSHLCTTIVVQKSKRNVHYVTLQFKESRSRFVSLKLVYFQVCGMELTVLYESKRNGYAKSLLSENIVVRKDTMFPFSSYLKMSFNSASKFEYYLLPSSLTCPNPEYVVYCSANSFR